MRRTYFGTDGFRGRANEDLTAENAFMIGRVLGWYFSRRQSGRAKIVIGKDTRRSCYMLEAALVSGIVSSGADAYLLHVTTTPSVSYVVRTEGFSCGVMISASHNPYFDNGIKLFNGQGEKMEREVLLVVEGYLNGELERIPYAKGAEIGSCIDFVAGRNRYVGYLISLGIHSFKGWRVGLDCANGSAWHIAKSVFDALGAITYVIGAEPNGLNVNDGCGSTHMEGLQKLVKEQQLDVGFAFDGDGDRCLCVEEGGRVIDGDQILYVCARYMKERGELLNDTIVSTVMSNIALGNALEKLGIFNEITEVGDAYVFERMSQKGCVLGGEQSGHILFSKYARTGDGVLTALKIMEIMIEKKERLSKLTSYLPPSPQVLVNVRTKDKEGALEKENVRVAIREAKRKMKGKGRILVRKSGTEPVVRVMAEGESEALCQACVEEIAQALLQNEA